MTILKPPELSIVIPIHNEAENILPLLQEIGSALDPLIEYEVICVDDGSEDETAAQLAKAALLFPRLRTIRHRTCCGQSTAIWHGVEAARSPWVATLDGDGQNDPADIPKLLRVLEDSPDPIHMVCGFRRHRSDTRIKRLSSRVANRVRGTLLKDRTPDTGCGLKLFSKGIFLRLPFFDHMHRFLPPLVLRAGGKIISVEVNHRHRTRGRSHYGIRNRLWVGMVDLLGVMWLQRRSGPPVRGSNP
jgi:dolichol-phosphate mannosyltransferase